MALPLCSIVHFCPATLPDEPMSTGKILLLCYHGCRRNAL